ncbi:MAG: Uma2 family endonuclease [Dehalococcoidia bacterium]
MQDVCVDIPPEVLNAPTEDDLPYSDGMPMESIRHVLQTYLLMQPLIWLWRHRPTGFVAGDMFVYFSPDQVLTRDFRGPDVFVAKDGTKRSRKSWVVWQEGGKGPDVVIELLSDSTARFDRTRKKDVYQDILRVPEYILFDPYTAELEGYALREGVYAPVEPEADGRLPCLVLDLSLRRWEGVYEGEHAVWLRWATADGELVPTALELAEQERQEADLARDTSRAGRTGCGRRTAARRRP